MNYYKTNVLLICAQERNKTLLATRETRSCPGYYPFPPSVSNHYPDFKSSHFVAFLYSCVHP